MKPIVPRALLLSVAMLTGCSGKNEGGGATKQLSAGEKVGFQKSAAEGKRGGIYTDSTISDPKTFNSLIAKETSSTAPIGLCFSGLVIQNPETLQFEPALAESFKPSNNGRTWTFTLRPNLKWSDGQPITADDVIFTLNAIYDPKVNSTLTEILKVDGKPWAYKKLDDHTIEIDLPTPFGPFLNVAQFAILPKHKLEAALKGGTFNSAWGVDTPVSEIVGNGPFVLAKYAPSESMMFKRNPYYWKLAANGQQLPFLDGLMTLVVPNVDTSLLKFKAKETDGVAVNADDWNSLKEGEAAGGYHAMNMGPTWGFTYLAFNQNPNAPNLPAYKREWFGKKEFRQAVSYAIDRDAMVQTVMHGLGVPLWSPVSTADKVFFNPNVQKYPHDIAKAKALLAAIGMVDHGGSLQDSGGHPVEFNLMTNANNKERVALCTLIQEDLKQVGIKVNLTPVEFNSLVTRLNGSYDWEAHLLGFTGGPEPHTGKSIWTSVGKVHIWYPMEKTPATPWEAEIDRIFSEAAKLTDTAQRKKLYDRWQEILGEQQPVNFLVTNVALGGLRDRVQNARPNSLGGLRWNIDSVWTQ